MREGLPTLSGRSDAVNEAYTTYCSCYLDFNDDNPEHLYNRCIDLRPIDELHEQGLDNDDDLVANAYLIAAAKLAKRSSCDPDTLYKEYPLFEKKRDVIEAVMGR